MPKSGEPKPVDAAPEAGTAPAAPPEAAAPAEPARLDAQTVDAAPEPAPVEAVAAPIPPPPPRAEPAPAPGLFKPALAGGVVGAALSAIGVTLFSGGAQAPAPAAPPAALVQPADVERLTQRIGALDAIPGRIAAIEQTARRLEERLAAAEARPAAGGPAAPAVDLGPLQAAVATLRRDLDQLPRASGDAAAPAAPALPPVDLGPVEREIARLSTGLGGLETALAALTRRVEATPPPAPPAAPRRRPARRARGRLRHSQIRRRPRRPVRDRTSGRARARRDRADVESLARVAAAGVATPQALARRFQGLARGLIEAAAPAPEGTLDRLLQGASRLVSVRPTGEPAGNAPDAIVARIETKLGRGDLAGALADLDALPESSRRAGADFRAALAARVEADRLMARVSAEVARALAPRG